MRPSAVCCAACLAIAASVSAPAAVAGEVSKALCQAVGPVSALEPLGDHEGHGITTYSISCRVESGPLAGGVSTMSGVLEWDKGTATVISGTDVVRLSDGVAVEGAVEGKITLTMVGGKVTGFTGAGKSRWQTAGGSAVALAGKTFGWTVRSTGPGQHESSWTLD